MIDNTSYRSPEKLLLMGRSYAGKTSMRGVIFSNIFPFDTNQLAATYEVEYSVFQLLGELVLKLWDCGGQSTFMEQYFSKRRQEIFSNAHVLIYVFDVCSSESSTDLATYERCISCLREFSPKAKVFCMVHKMDLIPVELKEKAFMEKRREILQICSHFDVVCFPTSIMDSSLYDAWSQLVNKLVPNIEEIQRELDELVEENLIEQAILFEKSTFLVVARSGEGIYLDLNQISLDMKAFLIKVRMGGDDMQSWTLRRFGRSMHIAQFKKNYYILTVSNDCEINVNLVARNIELGYD